MSNKKDQRQVLPLYWVSVRVFLLQLAHPIPHTCQIMQKLLWQCRLNGYSYHMSSSSCGIFREEHVATETLLDFQFQRTSRCYVPEDRTLYKWHDLQINYKDLKCSYVTRGSDILWNYHILGKLSNYDYSELFPHNKHIHIKLFTLSWHFKLLRSQNCRPILNKYVINIKASLFTVLTHIERKWNTSCFNMLEGCIVTEHYIERIKQIWLQWNLNSVSTFRCFVSVIVIFCWKNWSIYFLIHVWDIIVDCWIYKFGNEHTVSLLHNYVKNRKTFGESVWDLKCVFIFLYSFYMKHYFLANRYLAHYASDTCRNAYWSLCKVVQSKWKLTWLDSFS
jgi:hypothetical protein